MIAYALAVNEDNPAYLNTDGNAIVAHPIFPVRLFNDCLYKVAQDPELGLDLLRLVHGEQDMYFYEPIYANDLIVMRGELADVQEKDTGLAIKARFCAFKEGRIATETFSTLFIRSKLRKKTSDKKEDVRKEEKPQPKSIIFSDTFVVDKDQAFRYSSASLDTNPIHLDENIARAAGLPGIILHGLCTMAMSTKTFVDKFANRDPKRLKRFANRFSKPVFPGDKLTVYVWLDDEKEKTKRYGFEIKNSDNVVVASNGVAEVEF